MTIGGVSKSVRVNKGCPQGSILGPTLWNVTMEALLKMHLPNHVFIQAYADDIALSVAGPNRRILVERAEAALRPVQDWADERGLSFSAKKSAAMMTKGTLAPGFTLSFGDDRIVTVDHVKYLGLWIDQKRSFAQHVDHLKNSSEPLFSRLRGALGAGWAMKRDNIMVLYRGVFLPKIAYGARFWIHSATLKQTIRKLGTIQRRALLGTSSAYNTTSTEALQVIAGVPPLEIEIRWLVAKSEASLLPPQLRLGTLSAEREALLDEWQTRWTRTGKGRWTFGIFPDVRVRLQLPIALGQEVTQFLTGHGNFRAKLAAFSLQPSPICACNNDAEDAGHVLFSCALYNAHRAHLELAVHRAGHLWPCDLKTLVSSRKLFTALVKFAKEAAYMQRPN